MFNRCFVLVMNTAGCHPINLLFYTYTVWSHVPLSLWVWNILDGLCMFLALRSTVVICGHLMSVCLCCILCLLLHWLHYYYYYYYYYYSNSLLHSSSADYPNSTCLTDQSLLIHCSAKNRLTIRHVLSVTVFCVRIYRAGRRLCSSKLSCYSGE
jgi:hypothetical protein